MLNNPLFYPENEAISYHAKIGIIVENFFAFWLGRSLNSNLLQFESNISHYLKGIVRYIKFKRIFVYLMNSLNKVFSNCKLKYKMVSDIPHSLFNLIETNIKYLSIYQKQKSWETIDLI